QREVGQGLALEAAYAGLRGIHLPQGGFQLDSLPGQYLSLGTQLNQLVPNPFFGSVANGVLSQRNVQRGQLLLPFPQYPSMPDIGGSRGNSIYHSLQAQVEKRFGTGGCVLAS